MFLWMLSLRGFWRLSGFSQKKPLLPARLAFPRAAW